MVQTNLGWRRFLLSQIVYLVVFALAMAPVQRAKAESGEALYERCQEAFATATQACTTPSATAGMTPQQQLEMVKYQQAMRDAQKENEGTTGINQNAKMMEILTGAQAAMAGIKATSCATQIKSSQSICYKAESALKAEAAQTNDPRKEAQARDARAKAEQSSGYKSNLAQVIAQMLAMIANILANRQIQAKSGGTKKLDCKNPEVAKSNVQCICEKDPKNPLCGSGVQQGVGANFTGAPGGAVTPSGGRGLDDDFPTIGDLTGEPLKGEGMPGTNESAGGGGGGGMGGGGGAPAGNFGNDGGGGGSDINKDVITGQSGGGGGGSGLGGGSGGSAGGSGGGSGGDQIDGFDLSKFLPKKSDFNNRGLAGMSVTAKDGITGPMGPSIWEKVSNQYQNQKPKLLLDK